MSNNNTKLRTKKHTPDTGVFAHRLSKVRGDTPRSVFAKEIGVSEGAVRNYEAGSMPAFDVASRIAVYGSVTMDWLIGASQSPGSFDDAIELPRFDVQASAGDGKAILAELPNGHFKVSEAFLARHIPQGAQLGVLDIVGDSMWPTLLDGDLAIVNVNVNRRQLAGGGVFVFTVGEDLYVKRLILQPDGQIIATSDNAEYPSFTFDTSDENNGLEIHGKVIIPIGPPRPFAGRRD